MLNKIEKNWPFFSIIFILTVFASLFFWPAATRYLSMIVIGAGLSAIITFTTQRHVQAYRDGKIVRPALLRNVFFDVTGIMVAMVVVVLVSNRVTSRIAQLASKAWGATAGILSALMLGLAVGIAVSLFVRRFWGFITKPRKTISTKNST